MKRNNFGPYKRTLGVAECRFAARMLRRLVSKGRLVGDLTRYGALTAIEAASQPAPRLGAVVEVVLLRHHASDGASQGIVVDDRARFGVVAILDDGAIGWSAPDLSGLSSQQLLEFVLKAQALADVAQRRLQEQIFS